MPLHPTAASPSTSTALPWPATCATASSSRDEAKLPQGVTIDTPVEYRDVQGSGEIWVGADGLPARMSVHLVYPACARRFARRSGPQDRLLRLRPAGRRAADPSLSGLTWSGPALDTARTIGPYAPAAGRLCLVLACGFAALALLVAGDVPHLYAAVVVAVILSMVVTPLLQTERALAFFDEQRESGPAARAAAGAAGRFG